MRNLSYQAYKSEYKGHLDLKNMDSSKTNVLFEDYKFNEYYEKLNIFCIESSTKILNTLNTFYACIIITKNGSKPIVEKKIVNT